MPQEHIADRETARARLHELAFGLERDTAASRRLLERVAASDDAEVLRALLTELGAVALLEAEHRVLRAREVVRTSALLEQLRGIRRDVGEVGQRFAAFTRRKPR